jgi:hypothetical protein
MPADSASLRALVSLVGEFYITHKGMKKAQQRMTAILERGEADEAAARSYTAAVNGYFTGFEREARGHLRNLDRRLTELNQVQFNLTAERDVAVKRIEATQTVIAAAAQVHEERAEP